MTAGLAHDAGDTHTKVGAHDEAATLPVNAVPQEQEEEVTSDSSWTAASDVRLEVRWREASARKECGLCSLRYADAEYACEF